MQNITKLNFEDTDVYLEEIKENAGKIIISDSYGHNYSYSWGAMGGTLKEFITKIDKGYFSNNLLGRRNSEVMDVNKTIAEIRKYIATEMDLPWFKEMEFQKSIREELNNLKNELLENPSQNYFVDCFQSLFISRLGYHLIQGQYDRQQIEKAFKEISEPWYFIQTKPSDEYKWLEKLHGKLKKELLKTKYTVHHAPTN